MKATYHWFVCQVLRGASCVAHWYLFQRTHRVLRFYAVRLSNTSPELKKFCCINARLGGHRLKHVLPSRPPAAAATCCAAGRTRSARTVTNLTKSHRGARCMVVLPDCKRQPCTEMELRSLPFPDCDIISSEKTRWPAHQGVLAAKSKVIAQMIQDLTEFSSAKARCALALPLPLPLPLPLLVAEPCYSLPCRSMP